MILKEILERQSVREYTEKEIEDEKLTDVLEAGRLAPSANNIQPWRFIVVKDAQTRARIARPTTWARFIADAPVLIVACKVCDSYNMGGWFDSAVLDIGIAVDHMTLQAVHLGLGTCWVGDFNEKIVKQELEIPDNIRVAALLTVGYPKSGRASRKLRRPLSEVVSFERF